MNKFSTISTVFSAAIIAVLLSSCAELKQDRPFLPVLEYERMIVGRLDAEYVGTDNCVTKCHKHEKITDDFKHSVHGEQIKPETGLPLVNCESCHGPGSLAIEKISDDVEENDEKKVKCDTSTFLDINNLPTPAQSLICLKCHAAASVPTLAHWNGSVHALNDVGCFDCHKLHRGSRQKVTREETAELCYGCHTEVKAENSLFSHHPIREKKMSCTDCHDPHGTLQPHLLKGDTPKELCTRCHMEKQGPFAFEHGDVTENCATCHAPHGSVNNNLLNAAMPFLCLQCHAGHTPGADPSDPNRKLFNNRCTDCHSQIHGTDIPTPTSKSGSFLR